MAANPHFAETKNTFLSLKSTGFSSLSNFFNLPSFNLSNSAGQESAQLNTKNDCSISITLFEFLDFSNNSFIISTFPVPDKLLGSNTKSRIELV